MGAPQCVTSAYLGDISALCLLPMGDDGAMYVLVGTGAQVQLQSLATTSEPVTLPAFRLRHATRIHGIRLCESSEVTFVPLLRYMYRNIR